MDEQSTNKSSGQNKKGECRVPLTSGVYARRCFMTGEYCSQLANIQKERGRLHRNRSQVDNAYDGKNENKKYDRNGEINAFVIMNFSNMSDVVYKWRIQPFVESLAKYFYFEGDELVCCDDSKKVQEKLDSSSPEISEVQRINVIRADSTYDSNYVICNRVCQQMQIADLIVVDVSSANNNVFYEFGMAVSLGKLILPICYSESFFKISIPKQLAEYEQKHILGSEELEKIKRHIDCYPWRRTLFEQYCLRYRSKKDSDAMATEKICDNWDELQTSEKNTTQYIDFNHATDLRYGFSDIQYSRFPYVDKFGGDEQFIGKQIYVRLGNSYNHSRYENNTLIIYTMDGFLNEEQAGVCIENYYKFVTKQMKEEYCFCGDRVGILIQPSAIPEDVKDSKEKQYLLYSVGEIIHLGMNEATYVAQRKLIKPRDFLTIPSDSSLEQQDSDPILIFIKNHTRNRSISIFPKTPVYVKRIQYGLQPDILDINKEKGLEYYFCYYHMMLRTLKYTNQLVVDISRNCLESLFWLGAAHGGNINAITIQHEESEKERVILTGSSEKRERPIFDVAGLWSAVLRSYNTDGFYHQLELAQMGIEQRSKLLLQDLDFYEKLMRDYFYGDRSNISKELSWERNTIEGLRELLEGKKEKEMLALESYYRDRFWKPMMRSDHLHIYFHQIYDTDSTTRNSEIAGIKWDIQSISTISHYLSVRTHVGEYSVEALKLKQSAQQSNNSNFISIGDDAKPIEYSGQAVSLAEYIQKKLIPSQSQGINQIHTYCEYGEENCEVILGDGSQMGQEERKILLRGFYNQNKRYALLSGIPCSNCWQCINTKREKPELETLKEDNKCCIKEAGRIHYELAQLVLWREIDEQKKLVWYQVSISGVSAPATAALSTLIVNEQHRATAFEKGRVVAASNDDSLKGNEQNISPNPLTILQETVRKKITEIFIEEMKKTKSDVCLDLEKIASSNIKKIKNAAVLYLSSILYRYFLPFLSLEDEQKLFNGMQYFLASLFSSETVQIIIPDKTEEDIRNIQKELINNIMDIFKKVIRNFRGVEALYKVDILLNGASEIDGPTIFGIQELQCTLGKDGEISDHPDNSESVERQIPMVNCLLLDRIEIEPDGQTNPELGEQMAVRMDEQTEMEQKEEIAVPTTGTNKVETAKEQNSKSSGDLLKMRLQPYILKKDIKPKKRKGDTDDAGDKGSVCI